MGDQTDGQWLIGSFGVHNFGRFFNATDQPPAARCFTMLPRLPWILSLVDPLRAGPVHLKKTFNDHAGGPAMCSLVHGLPGLGRFLLAGRHEASQLRAARLSGQGPVHRLLRRPLILASRPISRGWLRLSWASAALAGLAIIVAFPIVPRHVFLNDD